MKLTLAGFAAVSLALFLVSPTMAGEAGNERVITQAEAKSWSPDARPAKQYAQGRAGDVSFSVFDMRGRQREFGGYGQAYMASTYKVMLLVAYLRRAGDRGLTSYDRSLLGPMIKRSDNDTASRIDEMLGRGPLLNLARDAEMKGFEWRDQPWGLSKTTARDQALFMRTLEHYVPERHWDYARGLLASITPSQRWGIGKVPVRGWHLHFKGGWGSGTGWVNHQVVLLAKDGRRIGLAVTTERSPSHEYGKQTLEGVFRILLRDLPR
ncbi:MAG: class A beta-lactamase-related serine hydrolase [Actinomycetota bacterium]|nr:class A beta-lactamase-related serine hydrolase [Actinomycetota bacterium]